MKNRNKNLKLLSILIGTMFLTFNQSGIFAQTAAQARLVYEWYPPANEATFPVVLVLGGSEGGLNYGQQWAKSLSKSGIGVMALAYFGVEGLNKQLEEIPYEYFQSALDTLKSFKGVLKDKIAIISVSKGTEAALLLASENKSVRLVIAASPSHVVWQGINRDDFNVVKSSWTKNGKPLPFLPYDYSRGYYPIINFYLGALDKPIDELAIIPLEKSNARIVLLSGGKDQVWPSGFMTESIKKRLKLMNHDKQLLCVNYPDAGHGFLIPFRTDDEKKKILAGIEPNIGFLGGTINAFSEAMTESNKTVTEELLKLKSE